MPETIKRILATLEGPNGMILFVDVWRMDIRESVPGGFWACFDKSPYVIRSLKEVDLQRRDGVNTVTDNLKARVDIVIESLIETSKPMAATVRELWMEYIKAEVQLNDAIERLEKEGRDDPDRTQA